jgi:hypothetical protein
VWRGTGWFRFVAAEKGNLYAEYALGILYLKGEDVPKDEVCGIRIPETCCRERATSFRSTTSGQDLLYGENILRIWRRRGDI